MSGEDDEGFVIRIRGLPWSSTKEEILKFFSICKIKGGVEGIHMTLSREGRPSGECYVELETDDDMQKGLDKHNEHMGHRYIEVFKSKRSEMEWVVKRSGAHQEDSLNDGCIRLRGLPFGCSKEEIAQFFSGLEIVPNGITLPTDYQGRSTGEAFVQFASRDIAENAMGKHKEKIGHRYIEIFKSSLQEVRAALGMGVSKMRQMGSARPSPYDRNDRFGGPTGRYGGGSSRGGRNFRGMMNDDDFGNYGGGNFGAGNFGRGGMRGNAMNSFGNRNMGGGGGMGNNRFMGNGGGGGGFSGNNRPFNNSGHFVHMRGLPFRAIEQDVFDFFRPINPINVHILYEDGGRPSGEADVEFAAHEDAVKAMSKDKSHMQHRYIELFLNSTPNPMGGNANAGNGGAIGLGNSGNFGNNMNSGMGGTGGGMGNAGGNMGGGGMGNAGGNMGGMGFGNNQMGTNFGGAAGRMGTGLNNLGMGNMNSGSGMGGGGNNPGNFYGTGGGGSGMGGMGNSGMGGMGNSGMGGGMGGNMGGGGMGMGQVGMMGVPDFTNF